MTSALNHWLLVLVCLVAAPSLLAAKADPITDLRRELDNARNGLRAAEDALRRANESVNQATEAVRRQREAVASAAADIGRNEQLVAARTNALRAAEAARDAAGTACQRTAAELSKAKDAERLLREAMARALNAPITIYDMGWTVNLQADTATGRSAVSGRIPTG